MCCCCVHSKDKELVLGQSNYCKNSKGICMNEEQHKDGVKAVEMALGSVDNVLELVSPQAVMNLELIQEERKIKLQVTNSKVGILFIYNSKDETEAINIYNWLVIRLRDPKGKYINRFVTKFLPNQSKKFPLTRAVTQEYRRRAQERYTPIYEPREVITRQDPALTKMDKSRRKTIIDKSDSKAKEAAKRVSEKSNKQ